MKIAYWSDADEGIVVDDVASLEADHPNYEDDGGGSFGDADALVWTLPVDDAEMKRLGEWANRVLEEDLVVFTADSEEDLPVIAMSVEYVGKVERGEH